MSRALIFASLFSLMIAPAAEAGKNKKKDKNAPPPVGWHTEEGWVASCYYPPNFDELGVGDRRIARSVARDEMIEQWNSAKGDGVSMREKVVMDVETVLLAKTERVDGVVKENLEHCIAYAKGGSLDAWADWLTGVPGKLTVGECPSPPLDYTLFDYLNIHNEWQIPANVCKNDHIKIKASPQDFFRITKGGTWIDANGDTSEPGISPLPCNVEGCFRGQLIMRFTADSGVKTVIPVGMYAEWMAPEHGKIEVMINDDSWNDNVWKVESGLEHHASIEYSPTSK